jgi:hypothetical protein
VLEVIEGIASASAQSTSLKNLEVTWQGKHYDDQGDNDEGGKDEDGFAADDAPMGPMSFDCSSLLRGALRSQCFEELAFTMPALKTVMPPANGCLSIAP